MITYRTVTNGIFVQQWVSISTDDQSAEGDALLEEMMDRLTPQWRMQNLRDQRTKLRAPESEQEVACLKGLDMLINDCAGLEWESHVLTDRIEAAERQLAHVTIVLDVMPLARRGRASQEGSRRGGEEKSRRWERTRAWCVERVVQLQRINEAMSDTAALAHSRRELDNAQSSRVARGPRNSIPQEVLSENSAELPSLRTMRRWLQKSRASLVAD